MMVKKLATVFCLILLVLMPMVYAQGTGTTLSPVIEVLLPNFYNQARIDITGTTEAGTDIRLFVNDQLIRTTITSTESFTFNSVTLNPNANNIIRIDGYLNNNFNSRTYNVFVDLVDPEIHLANPLPAVLDVTSLTIDGLMTEAVDFEILLNDEDVYNLSQATSFNYLANFPEGANNLKFIAVDPAGNQVTDEYTINIDTQPPTLTDVSPLEDSPFYYEGRAIDDVTGKTEPGARVYMFVVSSSVRDLGDLTAARIEELAQYRVTADSNGDFRFDDVDFEHPLPTVESLAPQQVSPSQQGVAVQGLQTDDRAVKIYMVVKDQVGLTAQQMYTVNLGSCFSGSFDFTITAPIEYQTPALLSPSRLEEGTEIITFVLGLEYRGRAARNRANYTDPNPDNYWEIDSVRVEPACRSDLFLDREPSYKYACQIMGRTPNIQQQIDLAKSNWYFRYNLGATSQFTNASEEFWESFKDNEMKFPLQVIVTYNEKLPGKDLVSKTQTVCREVAYFVDIPVDPKKVLPDWMLLQGRRDINNTIHAIDKVIEPLDKAIRYIGLTCLGGAALRFALQVVRRFQQTWAIQSCKLEAAQSTGSSKPYICYIENKEILEKCYYITKSGKKPIPTDDVSKEALSCPVEAPLQEGVTVDAEAADPSKPANLANSQNAKHFSGVSGTWNSEGTLYTLYRYVCDRTFCHAAPAKWTQKESVALIRQQKYKERMCSPDSSTARFLTPIDNCYETHSKQGNLALDVTKAQIPQNRCYALGNELYVVNKDNKNELLRVDKQAGGLTRRKKISAVQKGNTFYTSDDRTCSQACNEKGGEGWDAQCFTGPKAIPKAQQGLWYHYGPTTDCFLITGECYCKQAQEKKWDEEKKQYKTWVAGLEEGGEVKYYAPPLEGGILSDQPQPLEPLEEAGEWPWSYRQWQIYRTSNGQRGVYYPPERYYSGRDQSAAFGMNYLPDLIFGTRTTEVNPFTQHIGAIQTACLTGIVERLRLVKSILVGMDNCLMQIQTTGKADSGVCKELFTQYVCNLVYEVFVLFQDKCTPTDISKKSEKDVLGIKRFFKTGSGAITESLDDMGSELSEDYGNAQLNVFLEGGSRTLMKKVCLASFGYDVGFDINAFLDSAYSVPFKTSASVFSNLGPKGRREYLGFDPTNLNSMYEYRAAWAIFPGCDLESYSVDLVAVTEAERRKYNLDCSAVNNQEPGSGGCDNLRGSSEKIRPFFVGGSISQGQYIDDNDAEVVSDIYRYDHMKITLNLNPDWDAEKCFESTNREGNQGVFYFPIHDSTNRDILQCSVSLADGRFMCLGFGLDTALKAWIEDVDCEDPLTGDWKNCDRVVYAATPTDNKDDKLKVRAKIFSSGEKLCLKSYVQTAYAGDYPVGQSWWWEIIGLNMPRTVPVEMELISRIDSAKFGGTSVQFSLKPSGSLSMNVDSAPAAAVQPFEIEFGTKTRKGVKVDTNIEYYRVRGTAGFRDWTAVGIDEILTDPTGNFKFTVNRVSLNYSKIKFGDYYNTTAVVISPVTTGSYADQTWKLFLELYRPDNTGQCVTSGVSKISTAPGLAFKTETQIQIKVVRERFLSIEQSSFTQGKANFNAKNYKVAADHFENVMSQPSQTREGALSFYWYAAAKILDGKPGYGRDVLAWIQIYKHKKSQGFYTSIEHLPEYKMADAYLLKIEEKLK